MQIYNYIFSFFLLIGFIQHGQAQVIQEDPAEEVKVFDPNQATNETDTFPSLKSVVHFGLLHTLRGRYPIFYEHAIGGYVGAGLGLGITHADYFRSEHSDIVFNPGNGKMGTGIHVEALTKVYFSGLAIEEYYIGLNGKFSTFNYKKFADTFVDEIEETHYEGLLIAGIQFAQPDRLLVYDYYLGLGISDIYTFQKEAVNIGGVNSVIELKSERGIRLIIRIGLKIGIKIK